MAIFMQAMHATILNTSLPTIAKELGKIIIPIGNTAEAANEIFRIMKEEKELHSYLEDFWNILEDGKTNDVISKISEIIKQQQ